MPSFADYSNIYLEFKEHELKVSTFDKYSKIVQQRLLNTFGDLEIDKIKPSDVKRWLYSIDDVGSKSKRHYISVLSGIFKEALYDEAILRNPVDLVRLPKHNKLDIFPFTPDEVNSIFEYSECSKYKSYVYISFLTGMRTGEIYALKKKDIDLKNGMIHVNRSRSRFGESTPKTFGSIRYVPILDTLKPILKDLLASEDKSEYLLVTRLGEPYRDGNSYTNYFWKQMLKKLNLKYRRPYTSRHTFATNMLYSNLVTPPELAQILGHSSIQMVYDVYVSFINKKLVNFDRSITPYLRKGI